MQNVLTAASVQKLKPDGNKRIEISDGMLPALRVVIAPTGAKTYAVRFKQFGKSKKLTVGPVGAFSLAEARAMAREALCEAARGNDPCELKKAARAAAAAADRQSEDLIETRLDEFISRHVSKLKSSADVTRLLRKELHPWKGRRVQDIARRDVLKLIDDVHERGSPTTARRLLANLKRFFSWLIERDVLQSSPCASVRPPSLEVHRDRVLSDDELRLVLLAADALGYPFGPMIWLLALTGQRRREVAAMEWQELTLSGDKPLWSLPASRTKNGRAHDVPLAAPALRILQTVPRIRGNESRFVFTTTGNTPVSGFSRAKALLDRQMLAIARSEAQGPGKVKLQSWRVHDLRRTSASGMARLGVALAVVERTLNHVSGTFAGIVGVYQRHDFAEEKRVALGHWANSLIKLAGGFNGHA
jgi:integrase